MRAACMRILALAVIVGLAGCVSWDERVALPDESVTRPETQGGTAAPASLAWHESLGYLWQSATGHLRLMHAARPLEAVIADPDVDPTLRARLETAQRIRRFASQELALPDNDSYTRYADLGRPFAVWNVYAAPPLSLTLRKWCFPVAGCVSYRGFFDRQQAEAFAQRMREAGDEAFIGGVPAYSTLGWFDDPLLNTFVSGSELETARLIFHELAHQRLYVKGDTTFNESYATAVERVGLQRWLERHGSDSERSDWQQRSARRVQFLALLRGHRQALERLFASDLDDQAKRRARDQVFDALRSDYALLKASWGGHPAYDRWFGEPLNTARLASVASYADLVPAFEALLEREGGDFVAFHAQARRVASLARDARRQALRGLAPMAAREVVHPLEGMHSR